MDESKILYFKDLLEKEGDNALLNAKYLSITAEEVESAYEMSSLPSPITIIKTSWGFHDKGWGNGYVRIVKGHKYYGKTYDDIPINVHGGLTFSEFIKDSDNFSDGYWVGFDTAHYGDTSINWPMNEVYEETLSLFRQLYHLK